MGQLRPEWIAGSNRRPSPEKRRRALRDAFRLVQGTPKPPVGGSIPSAPASIAGTCAFGVSRIRVDLQIPTNPTLAL